MTTGTPVSFQSFAHRLRNGLLNAGSVERLLDLHRTHQQFLKQITPVVTPHRLALSDRFAWKFICGLNVLNPCFIRQPSADPTAGMQRSSSAQGVYQDLHEIIQQVKRIWFPAMETPPRIAWLKHYSVRKLAHYSFKEDEIAVSLIFDFPDTPAEILSYLAYHELLHRQLGARRVKGRRYAHTPEFKSQEYLFPNRRRLDEQISRYLHETG